MRRHDFYSSAEVKFAIKAEPIWTIELAASLKMIFVGSSSEREGGREDLYLCSSSENPKDHIPHRVRWKHHVLGNSQKAVSGGRT